MTDEQRERVAGVIGTLVRAARAGGELAAGAYLNPDMQLRIVGGNRTINLGWLAYSFPEDVTLPPLTTADRLALAVLCGDESAAAAALADYLEERGVEPVKRVCQICGGSGGREHVECLEFGGMTKVWDRCPACQRGAT